MPARKKPAAKNKLSLKLTAAERKLLLEEPGCLQARLATIVQDTPAGQPVLLTRKQLETFGQRVATEAIDTKDKPRKKKLDGVLKKVFALLEDANEVDRARESGAEENTLADMPVEQHSVRLAVWTAQMMDIAEQLGVRERKLKPSLTLSPYGRQLLLEMPDVPQSIQKKLAKNKIDLTVEEAAGLVMALAEGLLDSEPRRQPEILVLAQFLAEFLHEGVSAMAGPAPTQPRREKRPEDSDEIYQFKITLRGFKPSIWRRIQVEDCLLDELHVHIQIAMGWTNSHLHDFEIRGERYGDPDLIDTSLDDFEWLDSTTVFLSDVLPATGKRFTFKYLYDFGDNWEHDILFEGCPPRAAGQKYPICLEGENACPPEDVGGIWGYEDFLEAIADPKHPEYQHYREWVGGRFSPTKFDAKKVTREMRQVVADWHIL